MAYCMYLRKSRADMEAEARGEGETLARHEKILMDLSKKLRLNVTDKYKEIVSGETIVSRPVMQQLLSDVEKGKWDGVLVVEVERLARGDTIDQGIVAQTFKFSNTKIVTPLKIYDPNNEYDEEYFEFGLFMSRREYKTINRRLQRGRISSVKEGKFVGSRSPYGYDREKLKNDKGFTLVKNPSQSQIVKMIFELYAYGEKLADGHIEKTGVSKITRKLNNMGVSPQRGKIWGVSTIRGMLSNPVYIGKIRWNFRPTQKHMEDGSVTKERPRESAENWVIADGLHDAIIDNDTWQIVQEKLKENPPHTCPKYSKIKNPLAGLVVCGKCSHKMVRRPYTNRDYPDTLICPTIGCNNISAPLDLVENKVLDALKTWLTNYSVTVNKQSGVDQIKSKSETLQSLKKDFEKVSKQKGKIYDLLEQGVYTTSVFLERSKSIDQKVNALEKSIKTIETEIANCKAAEKSKNELIPKAEKVLEEYGRAADAAEKNELLKSVIDKVVYLKEVNGRWHGSPDDFNISLYPKIPKTK